MKIVIIAASQRPKSQSAKVAGWISEALKTEHAVDMAPVIDLGAEPLTIEIAKAWTAGSPEQERVAEFQSELEGADGFVIISPEWNGMATATAKNMFHFVEKTMAHKPALLVSVSAGQSGQYPISDLRATSTKNTRVVYTPDHLIVRDVNNVMNAQTPQGDGDSSTQERAHYTLALLVEYAKALTAVRESGKPDHERYPNGM